MDWRALLAFAAGAILASLTPILPPSVASALALPLLIGLVCWRRASLLPVAFLLGVAWFLFHAAWQLERQWPQDRAGELVTLTGTVTGLVESRGQGIRFEFRPDAQPGQALPARIQVSWFRPTEPVQPGQRWSLPLRLEPPHGRLNPGGFDFERHLLAQRIGALGRVNGQPEWQETRIGAAVVDRRRQFLSEVLQSETTRADAAALKRALALADRGGMDPALSEMLRQTGTAHLLAISGLHIGMVAGIAALIGGWLLAPLVLVHARLDRRRLAMVSALAAAAAYALLAGWTLPTQRALIMLAVAVGALLLRRGLMPGHALLLALVAVLLVDPMAPLATGFWLSFAAVAVLIWVFAWRPAQDGGTWAWLSGLLRAQLAIALGMLALNVGVFGQLVPVALAANLIAIPLVGFWILPSLLASVGLILLDLPAGWLIQVTETGLVLLLFLLEHLHGLDGGHLRHAGGGLLAMVLALFGSFWLLAPSGWPGRWLGAFLLLPLLWPPRAELAPDELQLQLLDVGSGLAVLVRTAEDTLLFDTGPGDGEGGDAIGRTLPGLLSALGAAWPDRVVVSHAHRAHAGGLASVARGQTVFSSSADLGQPCHAGEGWQSGGYTFRFLHPSPALPDLGANSSCVLHIQGPGGSVLLTGGIDTSVESRLLLEQPGLEAQVLVLSASGHRRGTSAALLEQTAPELALVSVARHDASGRPHPEVRQRLERAGVPLLSTAQCGAIELRLHPEQGVLVTTTVGQRQRFWRREPDCS
jgi:competence protein ComEC